MKELFKLMKWANHADHVNYDFSKDDIDVENIAKYKENNKMSVMDELESIIKSDKLYPALEEWITEHDFGEQIRSSHMLDVVIKFVENELTTEEKKSILNLKETEWGLDFTTFPTSIIDKMFFAIRYYDDNLNKVRPPFSAQWQDMHKGDVDDAIDDLEGIIETYNLSDDEWSSVDDASDYLFEHKGPQEDEEE